MTDPYVDIRCGDAIEVMAGMDGDSVDCCVTSPPYWGLRKYAGEQERVWGGKADCVHEWGIVMVKTQAHKFGETNPGKEGYTKDKGQWPATQGQFCQKCGAWRGAFGLEPSPELYVEHTLEVLRAVRRVLKPWGTVWYNLGDSYAGSNNGSNGYRPLGSSISRSPEKYQGQKPGLSGGLKPLDLCLIPEQVVLAARQDGWYARSIAVWHKCLEGTMPIYCRSKGKALRTTVKEMSRLPLQDLYLPSPKGSWIKVLKVQALGKQDTLTLHLRNGSRLQVAPDHRFPIKDRGLVEASAIVRGDELELGILPSEVGHEFATYDLGFVVGLFVAEGNFEKKNCTRFSLHSKETDLARAIKNIATLYGADYRDHTYNNSMAVIVSGIAFKGIIQQFVEGEGAKKKHLSQACFNESDKFLDGLLKGYLAGDGGWDGFNERWRLGFAWNYELLCDLRVVCTRLRYWMRAKGGRTKYQNGVKAIVRGEIRLLRRDLPKKCDREVVLINRTSGPVYEIETEGPHLFTLPDGTVTHNSNPMPESIRGWFWSKHRVKVGESNIPMKQDTVRGSHSVISGGTGKLPEYRDCPGCPKCSPNDGLVLRKGSWRPTDAYEQILMLTKSHEYFSDGEEVRDPQQMASLLRTTRGWEGDTQRGYPNGPQSHIDRYFNKSLEEALALPGRNLRNVWTFPTTSFKGAHFAVYPERLPEICILASTPAAGVCSKCGRPWARVIEKAKPPASVYTSSAKPEEINPVGNHQVGMGQKYQNWLESHPSCTLGFRPTCTCKAPSEPALVLDPFAGAGTTGVVAKRLGRKAVLIDIAPEYCEMARKRVEATAAPMRLEC